MPPWSSKDWASEAMWRAASKAALRLLVGPQGARRSTGALQDFLRLPGSGSGDVFPHPFGNLQDPLQSPRRRGEDPAQLLAGVMLVEKLQHRKAADPAVQDSRAGQVAAGNPTVGELHTIPQAAAVGFSLIVAVHRRTSGHSGLGCLGLGKMTDLF